MIDVEQGERDLDALPGDELLVRKSQLKMFYAEIRAGQEAKRALAKLAGTATVLAAAASVRVSCGYEPSKQTRAA